MILMTNHRWKWNEGGGGGGGGNDDDDDDDETGKDQTEEEELSTYLHVLFKLPSLVTRSGELQTQKLKSHLVRTQSLNVLPLKPGVSQYIAIHATITARDFFLAYFYPSGPFTCIFPKHLPIFSSVGSG